MEADTEKLIGEIISTASIITHYDEFDYRDPSPGLDAACVKYLEARGMVCLKRHTEAPTEEGLYAIIAKGQNGIVSWSQNMYRAGHDLEFARKHDPSAYALGPLPEGK